MGFKCRYLDVRSDLVTKFQDSTSLQVYGVPQYIEISEPLQLRPLRFPFYVHNMHSSQQIQIGFLPSGYG